MTDLEHTLRTALARGDLFASAALADWLAEAGRGDQSALVQSQAAALAEFIKLQEPIFRHQRLSTMSDGDPHRGEVDRALADAWSRFRERWEDELRRHLGEEPNSPHQFLRLSVDAALPSEIHQRDALVARARQIRDRSSENWFADLPDPFGEADPRTRFLELHIAAARQPVGSRERRDLEGAADELLAQHAEEWSQHSPVREVRFGDAVGDGVAGFSLSLRRVGLEHLPRLLDSGMLLALRGLVLWDPTITDDDLLPLAEVSCVLESLENLDLSYTEISDEGLAHLAGLRSLREVCLSCTGIRGGGLIHLVGLTELRALDLSLTGTALSPNLLDQFPDLESLNLRNTEVTGAALRPLARMAKLRDLDLAVTEVGDDVFEYLQNARNLRTLNLSYTLGTPAGLVTLARCDALSDDLFILSPSYDGTLGDYRRQLRNPPDPSALESPEDLTGLPPPDREV